MPLSSLEAVAQAAAAPAMPPNFVQMFMHNPSLAHAMLGAGPPNMTGQQCMAEAMLHSSRMQSSILQAFAQIHTA